MILRHPHALGLKKDYTDFNYRDISNVVLKKGIMRSTIECTLRFGGDPLALNDLPNSEAEKAYGLIRENLWSGIRILSRQRQPVCLRFNKGRRPQRWRQRAQERVRTRARAEVLSELRFAYVAAGK